MREAGFWPPRDFWISASSRQDFGGRDLVITAGFWPPRFLNHFRILAAEISESRQDFGRRDFWISVAKILPRISPRSRWKFCTGTHLGCWENTRKACKSLKHFSCSPNIRVGYHAGKPIESMVYCLIMTSGTSTFFSCLSSLLSDARHFREKLLTGLSLEFAQLQSIHYIFPLVESPFYRSCRLRSVLRQPPELFIYL